MPRSFHSVLTALPQGIAVLAAMLLAMPVALAVTIPTLEVSTTQRGPNTTIDQGTSKIWNFSIRDGFTIEDIVGSFVLKEGQGTMEPITFSLFGGANAMGAPLATTSVAAGTVGQSFNNESPVRFLLNAVNISAGNYSLKLYSSAEDSGRYQWFFKGAGEELAGSFAALEAIGAEADSVPVPEPGTLAMLGLGLVGLGLSRRRKAT